MNKTPEARVIIVGFPILQVLGLLLIAMKMMGHTDMDWFWVAVPFALDFGARLWSVISKHMKGI